MSSQQCSFYRWEYTTYFNAKLFNETLQSNNYKIVNLPKLLKLEFWILVKQGSMCYLSSEHQCGDYTNLATTQ